MTISLKWKMPSVSPGRTICLIKCPAASGSNFKSLKRAQAGVHHQREIERAIGLRLRSARFFAGRLLLSVRKRPESGLDGPAAGVNDSGEMLTRLTWTRMPGVCFCFSSCIVPGRATPAQAKIAAKVNRAAQLAEFLQAAGFPPAFSSFVRRNRFIRRGIGFLGRSSPSAQTAPPAKKFFFPDGDRAL